MQSVSKSVTSALIGIAIGRGEIPGVDAKMMPYFSAFAIPPDPRRDRMTLRDVLTMTTGIRWDEESTEYTDPANNCAVMEGKEDWVRYVLEQPMAEDPGKVFVYNSGATMLLSELIRKTTGKAGRRLREGAPLCAARHRVLLEAHAEGPRRHGGRALPRAAGPREDRIPLPEGRRVGRQAHPAGGLGEGLDDAQHRDEREGVRLRLPVVDHAPNGAGTYDAYAAWGYGGQLLIVVPELELITVFTAGTSTTSRRSIRGFALGRVLAALKK